MEKLEQTDMQAHESSPELLSLLQRVKVLEQENACLKDNEADYRVIFEFSNAGKTMVDSATGRYLRVNQKFCELTGYSAAELQSMTFGEITHPDDRAADHHAIQGAIHGSHNTWSIEKRYIRKDGTSFWALVSGTIIRDSNDKPQRSFALIQDLTERKQAEKALRESEMRLRTVLDTLPVGVLIIGADGRLVENNAMADRIWGGSAPDTAHAGDEFGDYLGWWVDTGVQLKLKDWPAAKALQGESSSGSLINIQRFDGTCGTVLNSAVPLRDAAGRITGAIVVFQDVTEVIQTQEMLKENERQLVCLFSEMTTGFALHEIICDSAGAPVDYRFLKINSAFEQLTGLKAEKIIGKTVREVLPGIEERWIETYGQVALTRTPIHFEEYNASLKRHFAVVAYSPTQGQFVSLFNDISEAKRMEEERRRFDAQMHHMQKLESLGVLAGGIAHDFNNLLVGILGNADLARIEMPEKSEAKERIKDIESSARRAADLCKQLLAYSGRGQFQIQALNLTEVVSEMGKLLEVSISKKAVLKHRFATDMPLIRADAAQIRQVVMNVITNASEAIGDQPGLITISTGTMECDHAYLDNPLLGDHLSEGRYVYFEVSDTGCGMDRAIQEKIFEPFFTTKFTGRGLGLSAVLGIVRGHKGTLKVYSEPGKGSTFKVLFPAIETVAKENNDDAAVEKKWRGKGVVLLVDDDEVVREIATRMLEKGGFSVLTVENGRKAVEIFKDRADDIVCVLLDLMMPEMDGEETLRELRRIRKDVRVLLASGYSEEELANKFSGKGPAGFLQKPFQYRTLINHVREVLEKNIE